MKSAALNNHEFLVDERDDRGREGGNNSTSNNAVAKQLFKIDLTGATDVSAMDGPTAPLHAVVKKLFLDVWTRCILKAAVLRVWRHRRGLKGIGVRAAAVPRFLLLDLLESSASSDYPVCGTNAVHIGYRCWPELSV